MKSIEYKIVKLKFKSGIHLSRGIGDNYEKSQTLLHSDTLKSAIFVAALQIFGENEIGKQQFFNDFLISSAFPFIERDGNFTGFLPKPKHPFFNLKIEGVTERKMAKTTRGIEYIDSKYLNKKLNDTNGIKDLSKSNLSPDGKFLAETDLSETKIFYSNIQNHVTVPRSWGDNAVPYDVDKIYFHEDAGLYFLVDFVNDEVEEKVIAALSLLADGGIGTDKSTGGGNFEIEIAQEKFYWKAGERTSKNQMAISLYCPDTQNGNLNLKTSFFKLIRRGGYIASPQNSQHLSIRKKSVYMFEEGSVFPFDESRKGKIVNLKPDNKKLGEEIKPISHEIWRDGQAIFLPINEI